MNKRRGNLNEDRGHEPAGSPQEPDRFELVSLLGYRLHRLSGAIGALAQEESMAVAGLSLPEYRVLAVVHTAGPCGVVAMQRLMMLDKAWISRTLTSLSDKKLVTSQVDTADARRTLFSVTQAGGTFAKQLIERAQERQKRLMKGMTPADVKQLLQYLSRIEMNVENGS